MIGESFDRGRLSGREDEIFELAIDGFSDQQIAQKLEISPSTVSSYWVRIRGKLGQASRTELVATALRQAAQAEYQRLTSLSAEYEAYAKLPKGDEKSYSAILAAVPEPLLAISENGDVLFANAKVAALFGYPPSELVGCSVARIIPDHIVNRLPISGNILVGIDSVLYGRRSDGSQVRIILLAEAADGPTGAFWSCIIRSFVQELDFLRRRAATLVASHTDHHEEEPQTQHAVKMRP